MSSITVPTTIAHVIYTQEDESAVDWPVVDYDESGSPTEESSDDILDNTGWMSLDLSQLAPEQLRTLINTAATVLYDKAVKTEA